MLHESDIKNVVVLRESGSRKSMLAFLYYSHILTHNIISNIIYVPFQSTLVVAITVNCDTYIFMDVCKIGFHYI